MQYGSGVELATTNTRLSGANYMVFSNSYTQQTKMKDNIAKYVRLTTAILNNIGHETRQKYCDFCSSSVSVDLDSIFAKEFEYTKDSKEAKLRHYIGRDWFPLAGSVGSDVQGLPTASRSLNTCAKCLFVEQYLPRVGILTNGLLTLFQSTSVEFGMSL